MPAINRENVTSVSTKSFETSLLINAAILGTILFIFTILRKSFKSVYEPRTFLTSENKRSPLLSNSIFSWPLAIWRADYKDIQRQNGMDAFLFVHFIRMVIRILLPIWIISWAVLLPLTSLNMETGRTGLDKFTIGNVIFNQSNRCVGHIVLAWLFTAWVCYNIKKEMTFFVFTRQRFLASPEYASTVQANTILITGVPHSLLCEKSLAKLFANASGNVEQVCLNRDLKEIPDLYERRIEACNKLESAETALLKSAVKSFDKRIEASVGSDNKDSGEVDLPKLESLLTERNRPRHRIPSKKLPFAIPFTGSKVDTIDWARKEISKTTAELERARSVLRQEATSSKTSETVIAGAKLGGVVGLVSQIASIGKSQLEKGEPDDSSQKEKSSTQTYPPLNSAFILFNNQTSAHLAAQTLADCESLKMSESYINVAPDDIIWKNLSLSPYETKVRLVISFSISVGLIILWSFPVAFCGALSNISSLSHQYEWLSWLDTLPSPVIGFIQGVLPQVLLAGLLRFLPVILRSLAKFEGNPTKSSLELLLMTRYFFFQFIHVFLVVHLSSGITSTLPRLTSNPMSIPVILVENLTQASNFFLTYIILKGLTGTAIGFLQVIRFIGYYSKLFILRSNPRTVYHAKYSLHSASLGTLFPTITLLASLTIAYSISSPIINGLACSSFFLFYVLYKYLFLYQLDQPTSGETGGLFFPKAIQHIFVGLYIQQFSLAVLLFLAQSSDNGQTTTIEGVLMLGLLLSTMIFHAYIKHTYGPYINYVPLPSKGSSNEKVKLDIASGLDSSGSTDNPLEKQLPEWVGQSLSLSAGTNPFDNTSRSMKRNDSTVTVNLDDDETEEVLSQFYHPAAIEPQRVIWIPADNLGLCFDEVRGCLDAGLNASTAHARMGEKGRVDVNDCPPEMAARM